MIRQVRKDIGKMCVSATPADLSFPGECKASFKNAPIKNDLNNIRGSFQRVVEESASKFDNERFDGLVNAGSILLESISAMTQNVCLSMQAGVLKGATIQVLSVL